MKKLLGSRESSSGQSKGEAIEAVDFSAALPQGSWLPLFFTSFFTGREEQIHLLSELLSPEKKSVRIVLCGQPGIGKTQLTGVLLSRTAGEFKGVHWIEAYRAEDIPVQIAACGQAAARANQNELIWPEKLSDQVDATLKAWQAEPNRLVILSHVQNQSVLQTWAQRLGSVSILATSSRYDWPEPLKIQPVPELTGEESISLLQLVCPRLSRSSHEELTRLGAVLGHVPLLLHMAGSFLRERSRITVKDFLNEIEKKIAQPDAGVSAWTLANPGLGTLELAAIVTQTLRLFDNFSDREWLALRILNTTAFFAPYLPVPTAILAKLLLPDPENLTIFNRSLAWLYSIGLVQQTSIGPVMHADIASLIKQISPEVSGMLVPLSESIPAMIASAPASGLFPDWLILPHLRVIAANAEAAKIKQSGALWNKLGVLLYRAGESSEARASLEHSLQINARMVGGDRVETAAAAAALGHALSDLGDLPAAKSSYEKALSIYERLFGPNYPEVANVAAQLGQVQYDMGDLPGAKTLLERALSIHENAFGFGPNHPAIANEADLLARLLRDLNDLPGAKKYYTRALEVEEAINGPLHPNIAARTNNLGRILYKLGELDGARASFERSLAILKITQGPENAALATALNNLGLVLQDLGSLEKAKDCFELALTIDEKLYGSEHPNVARDSNNLGSVLSSQGKLAAARDCFTRALEIDQAIFGPAHPNNAINANNLGRVLYNLGDLNGAQKAFERALEVDQKLHGSGHTRVGTDLNNLGTVMYEKSDYRTAKTQFERALAIFIQQLEPGHAKIAYAQKFLDRISNKLNG